MLKQRGFVTSFLILSFLFLAGCVAPVTHATPSGKVEVSISGVSKAAIRDRLTNDMINKGFLVVRSDESLLVVDRPVDNPLAAALLGSRYDSTPNARITFNIIKVGAAVRVIADCAIITNPGSGFERRTDVNNNAETVKIQSWLDKLKASFRKK
jgi:hypothetical protein